MTTHTETLERKHREDAAARCRQRIAELRRWIELVPLHEEIAASELYTKGILPTVETMKAEFERGAWAVDPKMFESERDRIFAIVSFVNRLIRHAGRREEYGKELELRLGELVRLENSGRIGPEE